MHKDPIRRQEYMKSYMRCYLKRRYAERFQAAVRQLGGCCVQCGSTAELQFDHIQPHTKSFEISDKIAQYAWRRIESELQKCQLLCFQCHVEKSKIDQQPAN